MIDLVLALLLHWYVFALFELKVTLDPWQIERGPLAVITAVGVGFTKIETSFEVT